MLKDPHFHPAETEEVAQFQVKLFSFVALWIPAIRLFSIFLRTVFGWHTGSFILPVLTALASVAAVVTFRRATESRDEQTTQLAIGATLVFGVLNFITSAVNAGSGVITIVLLLVLSGAFYTWVCRRYAEANRLLFSLKRAPTLRNLSP